MTKKLYKCEGFSATCWLENACVIKSTFNPNHIWKRSKYVEHAVRNILPLEFKCEIDKKIKKAVPCQ